MTNTTFHVISHTHWDREWYLPFEVFRIELVELIDNLLNILEQNRDFIFHLDGQTIILQDYLEIKPHKKEQIKKFIKSGNVLIGPWYVLSDQFLTSGEATVRNLLYGIRDSKEFGSILILQIVEEVGEMSRAYLAKHGRKGSNIAAQEDETYRQELGDILVSILRLARIKKINLNDAMMYSLKKIEKRKLEPKK